MMRASVSPLLTNLRTVPPAAVGAAGRREPGVQLEHDQDLVQRLGAAGFEGAEYDQLVDDLWLYGMRVMTSKIHSGEIRELCYQQGIPLSITSGHLAHLRASREDRDELAVRTVAWAVEQFKAKALEQHKWDAKRGATLLTYFIGTCAFGFHHQFRMWRRERQVREKELLGFGLALNTSDQRSGRASLDPAELVAMRDTISRILEHASIELRLICRLILEGLTHAEIGTRIGNISARAVEGKLYRFRKKLRRLASEGVITIPSAYWAHSNRGGQP